MALAVPLLIMAVLLASAWGLGVLGRSRGSGFMKLAGAAGVIAIFALPVLFDLIQFDGNCIDVYAATQPCTMSERFWNSLQLGFALTIPPAIMWLVTFVMSSRLPK